MFLTEEEDIPRIEPYSIGDVLHTVQHLILEKICELLLNDLLLQFKAFTAQAFRSKQNSLPPTKASTGIFSERRVGAGS